MKRMPIMMTLLLLIGWLLLNSTVSIGHVVLGLLLALSLVSASTKLRPLRPRLRRIDVALKLFARVFIDILVSNIAVAGVILMRHDTVRSGTVVIPLDLHDPHALGALAVIVTSTPGTVWQGLSPNRKELTLHVLDLVDEADLIRKIKNRYEAPLKEIFE